MAKQIIQLEYLADIAELADPSMINCYSSPISSDYSALLIDELFMIEKRSRMSLEQAVTFEFIARGYSVEVVMKVFQYTQKRAQNLIDAAISKAEQLCDVGLFTVIAEEFGLRAAYDWLYDQTDYLAKVSQAKEYRPRRKRHTASPTARLVA